MSNWFERYLGTPVGVRLADIVDTPENMAAFGVLSSEGKPAVQAVAGDVGPVIDALPTRRERHSANQFVGWFVGQMMRGAGYRIVRDRGRVSNAPYKTGAVWQLVETDPVFTRQAPAMATNGRIAITVSRQDTQVVAKWDVATSETSPITGVPRRVHEIRSITKPVYEAVREVRDYARRHGFTSIWVRDPENLFTQDL